MQGRRDGALAPWSYSFPVAVVKEPGHYPGRSGAPQVWQCGGSMEVLPCPRVAHIERTKKPYNNDIDYYKRNASASSRGVDGRLQVPRVHGLEHPHDRKLAKLGGEGPGGRGNTWGRPQGHQGHSWTAPSQKHRLSSPRRACFQQL